MKMNNNYEDKQSVIIGGSNESVSFGITNNAAFLHNLSDTLYSDKLLAALREPICNAWDAHIDAGIPDTPIDVTFKNNNVIVRDYGKGIPSEDFYSIYGTFGGSTKQNDLDSTGGFGLGCKAPLAVTDTFTVVNIYDGIKSVYSITKYSEIGGKPAINLIHSGETSEPSGVTVSIPMDKDGHELNNEKEAEELVRYISLVSELPLRYQGKVMQDSSYIEYDENNVAILACRKQDEDANNISIIHHNVKYPLNVSKLSSEEEIKIRKCWDKISNVTGKKFTIFIKAPKNTIHMTPSRESLSYTTKTLETLVVLIDKLEKSVDSFIEGYLNDFLSNAWKDFYDKYGNISVYVKYFTSTISAYRQLYSYFCNYLEDYIQDIYENDLIDSNKPRYFNKLPNVVPNASYVWAGTSIHSNVFHDCRISTYGVGKPIRDYFKAFSSKFSFFFKNQFQHRTYVYTTKANTLTSFIQNNKLKPYNSKAGITSKIVFVARTKKFFEEFHDVTNNAYSTSYKDTTLDNYKDYHLCTHKKDIPLYSTLLTLTKKVYDSTFSIYRKELEDQGYLVVDLFKEQEKYEEGLRSVSTTLNSSTDTRVSNKVASFMEVMEEYNNTGSPLTASKFSPPTKDPKFIMLWSPRTEPFNDYSIGYLAGVESARGIYDHLKKEGNSDAIVVTTKARYEEALENYKVPNIVEYAFDNILKPFLDEHCLTNEAFDYLFLNEPVLDLIYAMDLYGQYSKEYNFFFQMNGSAYFEVDKVTKFFNKVKELNDDYLCLDDTQMGILSSVNESIYSIKKEYDDTDKSDLNDLKRMIYLIQLIKNQGYLFEVEPRIKQYFKDLLDKYYAKYCPLFGSFNLFRIACPIMGIESNISSNYTSKILRSFIEQTFPLSEGDSDKAVLDIVVPNHLKTLGNLINELNITKEI